MMHPWMVLDEDDMSLLSEDEEDPMEGEEDDVDQRDDGWSQSDVNDYQVAGGAQQQQQAGIKGLGGTVGKNTKGVNPFLPPHSPNNPFNNQMGAG